MEQANRNIIQPASRTTSTHRRTESGMPTSGWRGLAPTLGTLGTCHLTGKQSRARQQMHLLRIHRNGRNEIYTQSFPPGNGKWLVSRNGSQQARWRGDGRELYFLERGTMMAIDVANRGGALELGVSAEAVRSWPVPEGRFAVTPDGQRYFYRSRKSAAWPVPITVGELAGWSQR